MIPCILSTDDDKETLAYHRNIVKRYGFEILYTSRLKDMKKKIEAKEVDCIHIDILFDPKANEPDWEKPNGLSELRDVLEGRTDIPVMVISGYIDAKAKQMAEEYGVSNAIYRWYSKPADYDVIALETIRAINEKGCQYRDRIADYLRGENIKSIEALESALIKMPTVEYIKYIKLKPKLILDKLENLCEKILGEFRLDDFNLLKELISTHLCDYFSTVSLNHLTLADYFVRAISRSKIENVMTDSTINLILDILKKLEKDELTDDDLYETKKTMENTFRIFLGPKRGSDYNVDEYIKLIINA